MLALATHILKLELYREDYHGPCARMIHKFVKRSIFFSILTLMEFRKMVTITLYARQKKSQRCIEQTFGLYGRRRGWDVLRE